MFRFLQLLVLLAGSTTLLAEPVRIDGMHGLGDTSYHRVQSAKPDKSYHVFVGLPDGYDEASDREYPTVYILDGGVLYTLLSGYYGYLNAGGESPDLILVAISYGTDDWENGNDRGHDFTAPSDERDHWGGAQHFQTFLDDELMPMIESEYRSDRQRRIVFGQSLGGQFVLFTAQTRPELFWGHIASNPALHRNLPFFLQLHGDAKTTDVRSRLFVGDGSLDDPIFLEPRKQWIRHWSSTDARPWELQVENLEGHSHFSAPPTSFRRGIMWLFPQPDNGD